MAVTTSLAPSKFKIDSLRDEAITAAVYLNAARDDEADDEDRPLQYRSLIEAVRKALLAQHDKPATFFDGGVKSVNDHLTAVASRWLFVDWMTAHAEMKDRFFHDAPWWAAIVALSAHPAEEARELAKKIEPSVQQGGASLLLRSHTLREQIKSQATFDFEDVYFDNFGALVVEYYLKKDRLTVVFEEDRATVMTMIGDKVDTKVFASVRAGDDSVLGYIKSHLPS